MIFSYPKEVYENYQLTIKDNTYIKSFATGKLVSGAIERIYSNTFVLTDYKKGTTKDSLTSLQKQLLTLGKECIELGQRRGDTIEFRTTFTANLHIQANKGIIVRQSH